MFKSEVAVALRVLRSYTVYAIANIICCMLCCIVHGVQIDAAEMIICGINGLVAYHYS
jgi:hypothetical protein